MERPRRGPAEVVATGDCTRASRGHRCRSCHRFRLYRHKVWTAVRLGDSPRNAQPAHLSSFFNVFGHLLHPDPWTWNVGFLLFGGVSVISHVSLPLPVGWQGTFEFLFVEDVGSGAEMRFTHHTCSESQIRTSNASSAFMADMGRVPPTVRRSTGWGLPCFFRYRVPTPARSNVGRLCITASSFNGPRLISVSAVQIAVSLSCAGPAL